MGASFAGISPVYKGEVAVTIIGCMTEAELFFIGAIPSEPTVQGDEVDIVLFGEPTDNITLEPEKTILETTNIRDIIFASAFIVISIGLIFFMIVGKKKKDKKEK